jgi:hypothetical protein
MVVFGYVRSASNVTLRQSRIELLSNLEGHGRLCPILSLATGRTIATQPCLWISLWAHPGQSCSLSTLDMDLSYVLWRLKARIVASRF